MTFTFRSLILGLALLTLTRPALANQSWQKRIYVGTEAGYGMHLEKTGPAGGLTIGYSIPIAKAGELGLQWNGQYGLERPSGYGVYTLMARWNYFFSNVPQGLSISGLAGYMGTESYPKVSDPVLGLISRLDRASGAAAGVGLSYRYTPFAGWNFQTEPGLKLISGIFSNSSGVPVMGSFYVNFLF